MRFKKKKLPAYAFIDSQNLNLGVQKAGWKMDWRKFRAYLEQKYGVTHAYMFIGYMQEHESLYEQMHEAGYIVVLKPTVDVTAGQDESRADGAGAQGEAEKRSKSYKQNDARASQAMQQSEPHRATKGNVDADLVLHCMKEYPNYSKAIIVSGDGDFFGLIEYLSQRNKLLHVMTPNWQYSTLLKPFEKYIVRIDQLKNELRYYDHRKKFKSNK